MYLPRRIRIDTVALISIENLFISRFTCTFEHQDLEVMFVRLPENLFINFRELFLSECLFIVLFFL